MRICVIGGAGYIGSHVVAELVRAGHDVVIVDRFSNSERSYLPNINAVCERDIPVIEGDYADPALLNTETLNALGVIDGIIQLAASKYVKESTEEPLAYFENNVSKLITLAQYATAQNLPIVFSSSAAVYGEPSVIQVDEATPLGPISPYGLSKLMGEQILSSAAHATQPLRSIALRYFNVVGADESGLLGETITPASQNLWPIILKVAQGDMESLTVFGNNHPTPDGSCQRDYVHVSDLARAHVRAIEHVAQQAPNFYEVYNVGTEAPTSVLEFINAFETISGVKINYVVSDPRPGDPAAYYASCKKIREQLGWRAQFSIEDALSHAWRYATSSKQ